MLRTVNLFTALSLGVQREQLEHRIGLTWPRPDLLRPLFARFLTMLGESGGEDCRVVPKSLRLVWRRPGFVVGGGGRGVEVGRETAAQWRRRN